MMRLHFAHMHKIDPKPEQYPHSLGIGVCFARYACFSFVVLNQVDEETFL